MFSKGLKFLFDNAVLPAALTAAGVAFPLLGALLAVPVIGNWFRKIVQWFFDYFIDKGVIVLKEGLLDTLNEKAKVDYAPQIQILRDAQSQDELTPEQEKEYAEKLDKLIRHRPDIVNG